MTAPDELVIHAAPHFRPEVHRAGFGLDHPYMERCWVSVIGPSATLFLRRLPELWAESEPARVDLAEMADSIGLGRNMRDGRSRIWRTVNRVVLFRFAHWAEVGELAVYSQVPPMSRSKLRQVPEQTREAHRLLVEAHVRSLGPPASADAGSVTARLDELQRPRPTPPPMGR